MGVDKTSPAFAEFQASAHAIGGNDLSDDWLAEIFNGADGDMNRAINHLLDTPDDKMIRESSVGQGFSQYAGWTPGVTAPPKKKSVGASATSSKKKTSMRGGGIPDLGSFPEVQSSAQPSGGPAGMMGLVASAPQSARQTAMLAQQQQQAQMSQMQQGQSPMMMASQPGTGMMTPNGMMMGGQNGMMNPMMAQQNAMMMNQMGMGMNPLAMSQPQLMAMQPQPNNINLSFPMNPNMVGGQMPQQGAMMQSAPQMAAMPAAGEARLPGQPRSRYSQALVSLGQQNDRMAQQTLRQQQELHNMRNVVLLQQSRLQQQAGARGGFARAGAYDDDDDDWWRDSRPRSARGGTEKYSKNPFAPQRRSLNDRVNPITGRPYNNNMLAQSNPMLSPYGGNPMQQGMMMQSAPQMGMY